MDNSTTSKVIYTYLYDKPPMQGLIFVPVFIITFFGIPGAAVSVRFYAKQLRTSAEATPFLLTALSVFDLIALIVSILDAGHCISTNFVYGWLETNSLILYIGRVPKLCSNLILLLLGIQRILCVVLPHKVKFLFTKRFCVVCVIVVAILAPISILHLTIYTR